MDAKKTASFRKYAPKSAKTASFKKYALGEPVPSGFPFGEPLQKKTQRTNYTPYIGTAQEYTAAKQSNTLSPGAAAVRDSSTNVTPSLHVSLQNEIHAAKSRAKREANAERAKNMLPVTQVGVAQDYTRGKDTGEKGVFPRPNQAVKRHFELMNYDTDAANAEIESNEAARKNAAHEIEKRAAYLAEQGISEQDFSLDDEYLRLVREANRDTSERDAQLRREIKEASDYQKMQGYYALADRPDFERKSGRTAENNRLDKAVYDEWYGDPQEYIDALDPKHRAEYEDVLQKYGQAAADQYLATHINDEGGYLQYNLGELTDDEKKIFNYILNTEGDDKAEEYLKFMAENLNYRKAQREFQNVQKMTGAEQNLYGFFNAREAGYDQFAQGLSGWLTKEEIPATAAMIENSLYNEAQGKWGRRVHSALTSGFNMLPSMIIGLANPTAGSVSFGISAGGNYRQEALKAGYTSEQATAYGILAGAAELTLEKMVGGLAGLGGKGLSNALKNIPGADTAMVKISDALGRISVGKQTAARSVLKAIDALGGEFTDEYLQEILNPVFRNICLGEDNEFKPFTAEALEAGIVGALMAVSGNIAYAPGGVLSAWEQSTDAYNTAHTREDIAALLENTASIDRAETAKQREILKRKLESGEKIDAGDVASYTSTLTAEEIADGFGISYGETEEMHGASNAVSPEFSAQGADSSAMQSFDGVDAPSSSMQFMAAENYTPERRRTIREYLQAANSELSAFIERVKRGEKTRPWFNLGGVNERAAADVQRLTGIDVRGYTNSITPNDVRHIFRRHGENGVADHSMRDVNDLARIEFVLQNYDDAELVDEKTKTVTNKDQSPASLMKFSKKIDGTYYVVEAVPDSNAQRLRVLSAYISAKKSDHGLQNKQPLQITPEATIPYSADTYNIAQAAGESQADGGNLQLRAEKRVGEVQAFAAKLGNAGRDVFVSMYDPDMDSAAYLEGMTAYYEAGKNGVDFSDVQSRYSANLFQPDREAAYFAGQVDAKALANHAGNGYTDSRNTKTEELNNGRRNQSGDRSSRRPDSLDSVQSGRSVQTGTSAVESGQTSQRQRAESIRTAVHAQRPVSTASQGLATGTSAKTLRIVPASIWTDDMRAAAREQSKQGRRVIYFTGELEFRSGKIRRFQARGALARDGKRIWVKADHDMLTIQQIIRHEEYHALVKRDKALRERTLEALGEEHGEEELKALAQTYVDLYGWTKADMNDVFEEIMADAYAGIDVFDGLGDLKSAVEYGDTVRREAEQIEAAYAADGGIKTSRERMSTDDDSGRTQQIDAESTGRISQTEEYARGTESAGRTGRKNEEVPVEASQRRSTGLNPTFDQLPKIEWAMDNTVDSEPGSITAHEQQTAIEYSVPSFVISDEAFDQYRGNKRDYPAFAYKGQIYLREHIPQEWRDVAVVEHEATHVMRQLNYAPYIDFLQRTPDMIIFNSDAAYKMVERISAHTGVDIFNAAPEQLEKFYDEINAGMYGHIAKGQAAELRAVYGDAFRDFDAYVRELTDIHKRFKRENGKKVKTSREATRRDIARTLSKMTPAQIALLTREDANTTPYLPRRADSGIDEQTGKKSKFADSVAKSKNVSGVTKLLINDVSDIRYYYGISNLDTLDAANERLNAGGAEETIKWYNIEPGRATAEDVALGFILLKRYQDAGMYNGAANVIRHLREIGTKAGQTVQAFSILGRLTPEGMAVYAQKELDKAFAEMIDKRGEAWAEKHKDMFQLTAEEIEDIRAKVTAASKLPDGRDKNVLLAQIAHTVEAKIPTSITRQLKAFTRISMLLNSKTMMRNVGVHPIMMPVNAVQDFIGAGIDRALSKQSGVRTTGMLKPSISAMKKGMFESYDDFRKHINTREIQNDRFEIGNGEDFHYYTKADIASAKWPRKATMALSDVLNTLDRVTNFLLDAGDRPFYEMYFINSLNNQMKLNHASEPTADMIDIATTEALKRTWQDDNAFTRGMANLRKSLNSIGSVLLKLGNDEFGLGNFVLAFVKTPANLIQATVEYSPAGLVDVLKICARSVKSKQFDPQTQKALVDALSKAITGTLVMIIGGFLARVGWITGGDDDKDEDLAAFERNIMGIAPYSVQINGKSYTYDFAQPISTPLAIGADIALSYNEDDDPSKTILNAIGTAGNTIFEQSFLKGLQELFGMSGVVPSLINVITGSATQFVPTSLGQIAQMADPYARTSYEYKDILQTTGNQIKAKLPYARNTLAPVVDVLGHDVLSNGGENRALNVFLNPSNVYTKTATQAAEEIYRVYGETGDVTVIPRKAPYYFDYKEKRYTFTSFERADYQRTAGQSNEKIVHDLLNLKGYTELDDDTKAKVLNLTVEYANALAKHTYLKEQKIDFERDSWMEKAENGSDFGVSVAEFILAKAVVSDIKRGLKDKNTGKTIENSESLLIMEAVYTIPGLSEDKRTYLFEAFGVGKKVIHYNKARVSDHLKIMRKKAGLE